MKRLLYIATLAASVACAQDQSTMNRTAQDDFDKIDARLNAVYKKLMAKLDDDSKKKMAAAERAWVAYRDAQAEYEADRDARGGSMYPLLYWGSEHRLTEERLKVLKEDFAQQ